MKARESRVYREAFDALGRLRGAGSPSDDLAAIARFMLSVRDLELPDARFPFVGALSDPRDVVVVAAYEEAWAHFIEGGDDESYG